jgi:O-antigen/teichoic acid export membrane protein/polysaccharide pyruvyl transferase WcaK-like protein
MLHGSFWMISLRWALRLTGVVSTIFLARLLSPADFGVVAAAMVVVGMLEMFNQTGQKLALIRILDPVREHFDSAWTISICIGLGIGAVIFLIAPFTKAYFHDARTVPVMQCLALRAVLGGFENIGIVSLRRNLQFDQFFKYNVYSKLISFVVTLVLAFVLRNYWALVAGILTGAIATNILSYIMSAYRPRFSLAKVGEIWGFSFWTFIRSIAYYLNGQVDLLAIGGFASAARMGGYAVAHDLAASPTDEINGPMVAVLFPVMAKVQHDPGELRRLYLRALGWSAVICASTSTGIAMVGHDLVPVLLGPKWLPAVDLIPWLAIAAGVLGLSSGAFGTFDALNMPRQGARMALVRLVMLTLAVAPAAYFTHELVTVAAARLVMTILFIPTLLLAVGRAVGVEPGKQISMLWRPVLAAAIMAGAIQGANLYLGSGGPIRLVADVLAGVLVYSCALLAFWQIAGRPAAPENDALKLVEGLYQKWRGWQRASDEGLSAEPLRICLYAAVPSVAEYHRLPKRIFNFIRRVFYLGCDLLLFQITGRLRADHLYYRSLNDPNKGDVLIREAVRQQLGASFAQKIRFSEIGWGRLDSEAVRKINASADIFVVAGSGYFFFDEFGNLSARLGVDAASLPAICCHKIAYGIGCNYVIELPGDSVNHLPPFTPEAVDLIRTVSRQFDAISVRDALTADIIGGLSGRIVDVTADPVLFFETERTTTLRASPAKTRRLRVGLNFAVHGRISAGNFIKNFDGVCRLLRGLRDRYDIEEFVYICHLRADNVVPLLLRLRGIPIRRRTPSVAGLADAYSDLDLNICQMMHSSILSFRAGVPTINLAYDVKNAAFFKLMGMSEFCLPMSEFNVEEILAVADATIGDQVAIRKRIEEAKWRLKTRSDDFRAKVAAIANERHADVVGPDDGLLINVN